MKEFNRLVEFLEAVKAEGLLTRQVGSAPAYLGDVEETIWEAFEPTGEERGMFASGWDIDFGAYSGGFLAGSPREFLEYYRTEWV